MNNNKQSSVEWLVEKLGKYNEEMIFLYQNEIQKAKAMHKEEIINFHIGVMKIGLIEEGERIWTDAYLPKIKEMATQYYNETFGGNNEQQ